MTGVRLANVDRVVAQLRDQGPTSRAELARATRLSPATITNIVRGLSQEGRVASRSVNGREAVVSLTARTGPLVCITVTPTRLQVTLWDFDSGRRWMESDDQGTEAVAEGPAAAFRLVDAALQNSGHELSDLSGVGIGIQAPVSAATGSIASWARTGLPAWKDVDLATSFSERLGVEVVVDNDANLAALAEWTWGAGRGSSAGFHLYAGRHVGGAFVFHGDVFHGADGMAGEIGHVVVSPSGSLCECGSRGCLTTVISERGILATLQEQSGLTSLPAVIEAGHAGDLAARGALYEAGRYLGRALANVGKLIAPQVIVLGGALGSAGDLVLDGVRAAVEVKSLRAVSPALQFRTAEVGTNAVEYGVIAALLRQAGTGLGELPAWALQDSP